MGGHGGHAGGVYIQISGSLGLLSSGSLGLLGRGDSVLLVDGAPIFPDVTTPKGGPHPVGGHCFGARRASSLGGRLAGGSGVIVTAAAATAGLGNDRLLSSARSGELTAAISNLVGGDSMAAGMIDGVDAMLGGDP